LPGKNALAYYEKSQLTAVKSFITLATGVNFNNILWTAFAPKSCCQKITNPNCKHIKAAQKLSYEKAAHKILVKLTPG
jgi:hypothetical protein